MEEEKTKLRTEIRKIKRHSLNKSSGECEICKARASMTSIPSGKKLSELLNPVDFDDLIRETEKLKQSNTKIESMISHHEINSQHSIEQRQSLTRVEEIQVLDLPKT